MYINIYMHIYADTVRYVHANHHHSYLTGQSILTDTLIEYYYTGAGDRCCPGTNYKTSI